MNELTDESLNRYIDGELSPGEMDRINLLLAGSEEARKKLYAFQLVHKELKKFQLNETSPDFTTRLMKKIIRKPEFKKEKYFIFSVSSIFILVSLSIIGYLISYIISLGTPENSQTVTNFVTLIDDVVHSFKAIFSKGNMSIIGSVFSFGIIISAYFFFDSHRQAKAKLDKL